MSNDHPDTEPPDATTDAISPASPSEPHPAPTSTATPPPDPQPSRSSTRIKSRRATSIVSPNPTPGAPLPPPPPSSTAPTTTPASPRANAAATDSPPPAARQLRRRQPQLSSSEPPPATVWVKWDDGAGSAPTWWRANLAKKGRNQFSKPPRADGGEEYVLQYVGTDTQEREEVIWRRGVLLDKDGVEEVEYATEKPADAGGEAEESAGARATPVRALPGTIWVWWPGTGWYRASTRRLKKSAEGAPNTGHGAALYGLNYEADESTEEVVWDGEVLRSLDGDEVRFEAKEPQVDPDRVRRAQGEAQGVEAEDDDYDDDGDEGETEDAKRDTEKDENRDEVGQDDDDEDYDEEDDTAVVRRRAERRRRSPPLEVKGGEKKVEAREPPPSDPSRRIIQQVLAKAMAGETAVSSDKTTSYKRLADELEVLTFEQCGNEVNQRYKDRIRNLRFNLDIRRNRELVDSIVQGEVTMAEVSNMGSEELANRQKQEERRAIAKSGLARTVIDDPSAVGIVKLAESKGETTAAKAKPAASTPVAVDGSASSDEDSPSKSQTRRVARPIVTKVPNTASLREASRHALAVRMEPTVGSGPNAEVVSVSRELESAVFDKVGSVDEDYDNRVQLLKTVLDASKNPELVGAVIRRKLSAREVAYMTYEELIARQESEKQVSDMEKVQQTTAMHESETQPSEMQSSAEKVLDAVLGHAVQEDVNRSEGLKNFATSMVLPGEDRAESSPEEKLGKRHGDVLASNLVKRPRKGGGLRGSTAQLERKRRTSSVWRGKVSNPDIKEFRGAGYLLDGSEETVSGLPTELEVVGRCSLNELNKFLVALENSKSRSKSIMYLNPESPKEEEAYWALGQFLREKGRAGVLVQDKTTEAYLLPPGEIAMGVHPKGESRLLCVTVVRVAQSGKEKKEVTNQEENHVGQQSAATEASEEEKVEEKKNEINRQSPMVDVPAAAMPPPPVTTAPQYSYAMGILKDLDGD